MSNIVYLEDFKSSGECIHCENNNLLRDLSTALNEYFEQIEENTDVKERIEKLQRLFVFITQETEYD